MIPGGNTRAQLVDAIVARLTAERDAIAGGDVWDQGASAGLAQAIDIVTELAEEAATVRTVERAAEVLWRFDGYDLDADPNGSTARELRPLYLARAEALAADEAGEGDE